VSRSALDIVRGDSLRRLTRRGAGSLLVQLSSLGLGFVLSAILARALGADGYGIYSYVFALITVLSVPAKLGLPVLIVREVARNRAQECWGALRGIIRWSNVMAGSFAILLAGVGIAVALLVSDRFTRTQLTTFAWALVLVPPMVLGEMRGAALRGLGRVVQGQLPERVLRPAFLILFCALFFTLPAHERLRPDSAMALHAIAALLAFTTGAFLYLRVRPPETKAVRPEYRHRAWLRSAWPLALAAGMQVLSSNTDIIMLGFFEPADQVGIYRAAAQCAALVGMSLIAINQVVAPEFAALHARGDKERLQRVATGASRGILLMAAPAALILIVFGDEILRLLFGPEFAAGRVPLALLVLGQVSNAVFGSVAMLLNMSGHEIRTARGVLIAQVFNIIANLSLIPPFGSNGAAAATAMTVTLWNGLLWYDVRRNLGINSSAFGR
jgi:O-antigen/teichoic acid export membrane protein